jgi:monoamine oxidase
MTNVIVIGAGAAGLSAARILTRQGVNVTVLEAAAHPGGRVSTSRQGGFSIPVELGAEFIHGNPPLIHAIAKEAGVKLRKGEGRMWHVDEGTVREDDPFDNDWEEFIRLLDTLKEDMPIASFLDTRFKGDTFSSLRETVIRFVQGFDAADATKASAFALRDEWASSGDAITGSQVEGGLSLLTDHLYKQCVDQRVSFHFNSVVTGIAWRKGVVDITTSTGVKFSADTCLVTIPPAVLKSGAVAFDPAPDRHLQAIQMIQTGGVVKFLFEFDEMFWDSSTETVARQFPDMHFIFSDAIVPTWWSQRPSRIPLLTGWLSGPITHRLTGDHDELLQYAVQSLAYIFNCTEEEIRSRTRASAVRNWLRNPFACGAYAYRTVDAEKALKILSDPIDGLVYFAGEAYYNGSEMGTVEAALASASETAKKILSATL